MEFVDTHAHLYTQEFSADISQVVSRSLEARVRKIYMPNIDLDTIPNMLALESQYPDLCAAMVGIHPCYIDQYFQKKLAQVEIWLAQRSFAAVGEIGIDLYKNKIYQVQQEEAFTTQLKWAQQYQLPVIIHCRQGLEPILRILEKHQNGRMKGIFHCFSGSLQEAERIIALGFYLGIGGIITFKNTGLGPVVQAIGLDHLVLETDAPYLAPTPHRGQRNEPAYLLHTAEKIAALKAIDLETVARVTTANASDVFKSAKL